MDSRHIDVSFSSAVACSHLEVGLKLHFCHQLLSFDEGEQQKIFGCSAYATGVYDGL